MRFQYLNLTGEPKRTAIFDLPGNPDPDGGYWELVTDVPCPRPSCNGTIRWHEAGFVPGYRCCDTCLQHFLAKGNSQKPWLAMISGRKGKLSLTRS